MCFLVVEDETMRIPAALAPPVYEQFKEVVKRFPALLIAGKLQSSGTGHRYRSVLCENLWPLSVAAGGYTGTPGQMAR